MSRSEYREEEEEKEQRAADRERVPDASEKDWRQSSEPEHSNGDRRREHGPASSDEQAAGRDPESVPDQRKPAGQSANESSGRHTGGSAKEHVDGERQDGDGKHGHARQSDRRVERYESAVLKDIQRTKSDGIEPTARANRGERPANQDRSGLDDGPEPSQNDTRGTGHDPVNANEHPGGSTRERAQAGGSAEVEPARPDQSDVRAEQPALPAEQRGTIDETSSTLSPDRDHPSVEGRQEAPSTRADSRARSRESREPEDGLERSSTRESTAPEPADRQEHTAGPDIVTTGEKNGREAQPSIDSNRQDRERLDPSRKQDDFQQRDTTDNGGGTEPKTDTLQVTPGPERDLSHGSKRSRDRAIEADGGRDATNTSTTSELTRDDKNELAADAPAERNSQLDRQRDSRASDAGPAGVHHDAPLLAESDKATAQSDQEPARPEALATVEQPDASDYAMLATLADAPLGSAHRLSGDVDLGADHVNKVLSVNTDVGTAYLKPSRGEVRHNKADIPAGDKWRREIAAYVLDRHLGFDLVPPTVARASPDLGPASLQASADGPRRDPVDYGHTDRQRMGVFDFIAGNTDRHGGNYLSQANGRPAAIDNGDCFPEGTQDPRRSVFFEYALGETLAPEVRNDLASVDRAQLSTDLRRCGLSDEAVGDVLTRLIEAQSGYIKDRNWADGYQTY